VIIDHSTFAIIESVEFTRCMHVEYLPMMLNSPREALLLHEQQIFKVQQLLCRGTFKI